MRNETFLMIKKNNTKFLIQQFSERRSIFAVELFFYWEIVFCSINRIFLFIILFETIDKKSYFTWILNFWLQKDRLNRFGRFKLKRSLRSIFNNFWQNFRHSQLGSRALAHPANSVYLDVSHGLEGSEQEHEAESQQQHI